MIYEANTVKWKVGDLVLHDADAKRADMLMRVVGYSEATGLCLTRYVTPMRGEKNRIYPNDIKFLHDPRRFAISLPDAGPEGKIDPVSECAPGGRVLVATMRLPVAVRELPVLVEWLERAYGKGLTMKHDGTFLCFMRPVVWEGAVEPLYGGGAGEPAAGAAAGTEPEGGGEVTRGGIVGELPDGTQIVRGGIVGREDGAE